jgi:hypothetical protein
MSLTAFPQRDAPSLLRPCRGNRLSTITSPFDRFAPQPVRPLGPFLERHIRAFPRMHSTFFYFNRCLSILGNG